MPEKQPQTVPASRLPFLGLALLLALVVAVLGGTSFQRRIDDFQPLGFEFEAKKNAWLVTRVAAPETGLAEGDLILREGEVGGDRPDFEKRLRSQEQTPLLVTRGEVLEPVIYARPSLAIDFSYLVLVGIGIVYLLIGLYTAAKDSRLAARLFYFWCLLSAALYIMSPQFPPADALDRIAAVVDLFARAVLPALTLHLFLVFPAPLGRSGLGRLLLPGIYLPGAFGFTFHVDQMLGGKLYGARASAATVEWFLRFDLWLLVLYAVVSALVIFARLSARPNWEKRRQMHWIAVGMLAGYVPFLLLHVLPLSLRLHWPDWTRVASVVPLAVVPLGFAYAILKYKLWDIGVILRDSIAYSLTVLVGLVGFALIHLAIQRGLAPEMTIARNALTFVAGLAVAGVLVPTKNAITAGIESWQYRRSLPHRQALGRLGGELLHERDLARLSTSLIDRLADGLMAYTNLYLVRGATTLSPVVPSDELPSEIGVDDLGPELWQRDVESLSPVEMPGPAPTVAERLFKAGYRYAFPLLVREHRVGILLVSYKFDDEPLNSEDLELARGLLNQASLAIENAHLLDELRRRLDEVSRLEEHNKGIIESSPVGLVVIDGEDRVVSSNQAFGRIVGEASAALAGRKLEEVLPVRPLPAPEDGLTEVCYGELSGRERYLQIVTAHYESQDRGLRILTVQDTSDLVAMEAALKEKERLASLGLLAAGVAHEVNTPLTGISSYAQLLLSDIDESSPHHEILKKLERQTFRAAQIVNNLLEFSRNRHDELTPVNLAAVVSECVTLLGERLEESDVEVDWVAPEETLRVLGHEGELGQVFTNLMVNALDAMAPSGEGLLTVRLERHEDRILARITDTGPGIAPERLERVFQPFFTSKGKGGTGLGLAITHNIVRRHRGTIRVENHPGGRGCTFSVELPCHDAG